MQRQGNKYFLFLHPGQLTRDGKQNLLPQQDISFLDISKMGQAVIGIHPTTIDSFRRKQFWHFSENKCSKEGGTRMRGCQRRGRTPTFFTFQPTPPESLTWTVLLTLERWKEKIRAPQKAFDTCQCKIVFSFGNHLQEQFQCKCLPSLKEHKKK